MRPAGTVTRPKNGVQHPDLDKAWATYDAAVAKSTEAIKDAIAKQFNAATDKGDLDTAEKWQTIEQEFEKNGTLPIDKEKQAVFSIPLADLAKAADALKKAYETLVKSLTKEKRIPEAQIVRGEGATIASMKAAIEVESDKIVAPAARIAKRGEWTVLFRSSNASHWDKAVNVNGHYAIPLVKAPQGVRFLRLSRPSGDNVIINMTNQQLGVDGNVSDTIGWAGGAEDRFGARHLGVYGVRWGIDRAGQVAIKLWPDRLGWGFGHKTEADDRQYCAWGGDEIPDSVFEISVKSGDLTVDELRRLLTK